MRIAVSGSHCTGKSTLTEEFLRVHTEFIHEPEPYTVLVEEFGEEFSAEPSVDDFLRQLEFNIKRLQEYGSDANVIYERCPIDFLAYVGCFSHVKPELVDQVSRAVRHLDLIVYLPLDNSIVVDEEEFPKLRQAVDRRLRAIYREEEFGIIASTNVSIVEATGPTQNRLRTVEDSAIF
jgi:hypothetical protein